MWIVWKLWKKKSPTTVFSHFYGKRQHFLCKKISTIFQAFLQRKNCGYCVKLDAEKIFADFYDISGAHSYQQVTVDTIL